MRLVTFVLCMVLAGNARAQSLPSEPISVGNGRFVFGGEFFGTFGSEDPGFFNYNDYEYNALRNVRLSVSTEVRASRHVQVLAEVRLEHGDQLLGVRHVPADPAVAGTPLRRAGRPHTADLRRLLEDHLRLQQRRHRAAAGLSVPAVASDDGVPATSDDLLRMRGRGWLSEFPVGDTSRAAGVPIVNTSRYDTGVQVHGVVSRIEWTGSVTTGSLSDPLVGDNNGRPQFAGRVVARALPGLALGMSAARAAWLDDSLDEALAGRRERGSSCRPRWRSTPRSRTAPGWREPSGCARRGACRRWACRRLTNRSWRTH